MPLGLTLVENLGVAGGIVVFLLGLILILRPFKIHVTVRHEDDRSTEDEKEEKP